MEQVKEDKINQEMAVKINRMEMVINQVHMNQIPLMELQIMVLKQEHQEREE